MTACERYVGDLAAFADGELGGAAADAVRDHVADCAACADALHAQLQLAVLAAELLAPGVEPVLPRFGWRRAAAAAAVAAAAVVVVAAVWPRSDAPVAVALATAPARAHEVRIAYGDVARHRPYGVDRAAARASEPVALAAMAELERRGDARGIAASYLLRGEADLALATLDGAPGADAASARAAALVMIGEPRAALAEAERALGDAPRHGAALWNRALALRELGLPLAAADGFDAVAALGEPGWSDEARARAAALRDEAGRRAEATTDLYAAGVQWIATGQGVTPHDLARHPGMGRLLLYDAVRAAPTAERVRALAPHAEALDAVYGGTRLRALVDRTAGADFTRRGQLAARYAEAVQARAVTAAYLDELRAAGADDILLGALLHAGDRPGELPAALVDEYAALAAATGDPWFELLAAEQRARRDLAAGAYADAELRLREAHARCAGDAAIEYRCARLALALSELYGHEHRVPEAARYADDALARARRAGEWYLEGEALAQQLAVVQLGGGVEIDEAAVATAYLAELGARGGGDCAMQLYVAESRAQLAVNQLDPDAVLRHWREAEAVRARCADAGGYDLAAAFVLAHLAQWDTAEPAWLAALDAQLPALRADAPALADHVQGRALLARDPAAARALLRRATQSADERARPYSYAALVVDAAAHGDGAAALTLLADELGVPAPTTCAIGLAAEQDLAVIALDHAGTAQASTRPWHTGDPIEPPFDPRCPHITILARPPFHGRPSLLPASIPWSYLASPSPPPGERVGVRGHHVLITDVQPPSALHLPQLTPTTTPADLILRGPEATPARALAAMRDASLIEIHAHGIVNPSVAAAAHIALSPDASGNYALTATAVQRTPLTASPLVILGACHAAEAAPYLHAYWSLPAAFIRAGARAVIASPAPIPDGEATAVLTELRARVAAGAPPSAAVRDLRVAHPDTAWIHHLVVFE